MNTTALRCKAVLLLGVMASAGGMAAPPPISPQPLVSRSEWERSLVVPSSNGAMVGVGVARLAVATGKDVNAIVDAWPRDGDLAPPVSRGSFQIIEGKGGWIAPGLMMAKSKISYHPASGSRLVSMELSGVCITEKEMRVRFQDMVPGVPHPLVGYRVTEVEGTRVTFQFDASEPGCLGGILLEAT